MNIDTYSEMKISGTAEEILKVQTLIENSSNFNLAAMKEARFNSVMNTLFASGVHLNVSNKVATIKAVRQMTGWSLHETKDWVEKNM